MGPVKDAVPGIEISFGTREGLDQSIKDEVETSCAHFLMVSRNPLIRLGHMRAEIHRKLRERCKVLKLNGTVFGQILVPTQPRQT
jgi:hypothetical protein